MNASLPLHDLASRSPAEMFKRNRDVRGAGRMKVKDLRPESKVDVIELTIRQKGDARDFSSRSGSTGKVADAKAVDDEGTEVSVSLWNDEIERVQANDRIRITNGWVREWRGDKQGRAGRYGRGGGLHLGGPTPPRPREGGIDNERRGDFDQKDIVALGVVLRPAAGRGHPLGR